MPGKSTDIYGIRVYVSSTEGLLQRWMARTPDYHSMTETPYYWLALTTYGFTPKHAVARTKRKMGRKKRKALRQEVRRERRLERLGKELDRSEI